MRPAMMKKPNYTRTPINLSGIQSVAPESVTKDDIDELSAQIGSLIERGRKLRDLKTTSQPLSISGSLLGSYTTPCNTIKPPVIRSPCISDPSMSSIVALIDAADPIFCPDPLKAPICTPSPVLSPRKSSPPKLPRSVPPQLPPIPLHPITASDIEVKSVRSASPRRSAESLRITLRKRDLKVSVEVWDKKTNDLIGIGLGLSSDQVIDCFDVWDNHQMATVTIGTRRLPTSRPSSASSVRTPTPPISLISSPLILSEKLLCESPINSPLETIAQSAQTLREQSYSIPNRQSTESFLSFISASPPVQLDDPLTVSSDDDEAPPSDHQYLISTLSPKKQSNHFDSYIQELNRSLNSCDECVILEKLNMDMRDLDSLTIKLRGGADNASDDTSTAAPHVVPLLTCRPTKSQKRQRKKSRIRAGGASRHVRSHVSKPVFNMEEHVELIPHTYCIEKSRSISLLEPEKNCPQTTVLSRPSSAASSLSRTNIFQNKLSLVCEVAPVVIEISPQPLKLTPTLEALRKESIEQARKNIVALKGSIMSEVYSLEGSSTPRN